MFPEQVALLAEGVDRNWNPAALAVCSKVALLAEGVDRNLDIDASLSFSCSSPSSRRAWIEMVCKIGVRPLALGSPSSRRAWIEICTS